MIELASLKLCTACRACESICPKHSISMIPDKEGFLQPVIDQNKCIECGMCMRTCPALRVVPRQNGGQKAFAMISHQDRTLSSSGGAFSVFSRIILNHGGIVFGATLDNNLQCRHIGIENVADLSRLRGAKYVQSDVGSTFLEVKKNLLKNRKVLFSGTPCQVAGLYSYLGKRYDDLLVTLDLICHGVPNQQTFNSYLNKLASAKHKKVTDFQFRKMDSWSIIPSVKYNNGKWERLDLWENAYMDAFFKGITFRESCFNCKYCNLNRQGTFTIADFWGVGGGAQPFKKNVAQGVSLVIDNQGKISDYIDEISQLAYIEERPLSEAVEKQHNLKLPMQRCPERDFAIRLMLDDDVSLFEFAKQCGLPHKKTIKHFFVRTVKNMIDRLGLYNLYKTVSYKMGKTS